MTTTTSSPGATARGVQLVAVAVAAMCAVARAAADEGDTAALTGRVEGAGAADALVVAECRGEPPVARAVPVGADGTFWIEGLPAGPCRLRAEAAGHESTLTADVVLTPGQNTSVRLVLTPVLRAPGRVPLAAPRGPEGQLPQISRTLEARLQLMGAFDGDRGPWGAVMGSGLHDNGYRLDGFDITDPLRGGPAVAVPLLALVPPALLAAARGAGDAASSGATIDLVSRAGSNRVELGALASRIGADGPVQVTEAELAIYGPVVRDHAWFAAAVQGAWTAARGDRGRRASASAPRASVKLSWQTSARSKLTLVALASQRQTHTDGPGEGPRGSTSEGRLLGATWETLLRDDLVARVQLAWRAQTHTADGEPAEAAEGWQAVGRLAWYPADHHELSLGARHEWLAADPGQATGPTMAPPAASGRRGLLFLEHRWRPTRFLTATTGVAYAAAAFGPLAVAGATPHLGLAWDATRDGRTAVRGSASSSLDTGSFTSARLADGSPPATAGPRAPRTWEVTAGAEREIASRSSVSADLVQRWRPRRLPGDPRAEHHRALLLALRKRGGAFAYTLSYVRQTTAGARAAVRAAAVLALGAGVSLGGTAAYGNRLGFARLAPGHVEPARGFTPAPGGGGSGWEVAARLQASLVPAVGQPVTVWLDALDLLGGRTPVGELVAPGAPPVALHAPGRQLRAGLSWTY